MLTEPDGAQVTGGPREPEAEAIHWMLTSRAAREAMIEALVDRDFIHPMYGALFTAIRQLHNHGTVITPGTVARAAKCSPDTVADLAVIHAFGTDTQVAREIRDISGRRFLERHAQRLLTLLVDGSVEQIEAECADLACGLPKDGEVLKAETFEEMLDRVGDTSYRWLVPWVLERGERLMIVGAEGKGKSVILRQWAFMLAAGCHWITRRIIEPGKVLIVDAENSDVKVLRASRWLRWKAGRYAGENWNPHNVKWCLLPTLDLVANRTARDHVTDLIEQERPDLLMIGPLYKIGRNVKASYEESALAMTDLLDDWRHRYGISIVMEHHAPKAVGHDGERMLDPRGSAVWLGWPDVGLAIRHYEQRDEPDDKHVCEELRPHFHVGLMRGSRGTHYFPTMLRHGSRRTDEWPWVAEGFNLNQYEQDGESDAVF